MANHCHTARTIQILFVITTKSGLPIATSFLRVVHGGRGTYIEFCKEQLVWENLVVPEDQEWRRRDSQWTSRVFYIEWRSTDSCNVKVYEQKRTVEYADYRVGLFYIAPEDLEGVEVEQC